MNKTDAWALVEEKVPNQNLKNHMLAVGVILRALADRFGEDSDLWELAGIVHDIDLGETDDPAVHGKLGASWLRDMGVNETICQAVLAHADHAPCKSTLDTALCAADQISGLIIACALVKGRKLANVTPKTVTKRFKEKRFAAGANRDAIMKCLDLGLELPEFTTVALNAMQNIAPELGL